jgi:hypothetical protein
MPDLAQLAFRPPDQSGVASQTNANAVVTLAAQAGYQWVVIGYTMSSNGNVAAAVTPDVVSGALVVDRFEAPAALPMDRVVEFTRGVKCPVNTSVVATIPALGAAIKGTVVLRAFLLQAT